MSLGSVRSPFARQARGCRAGLSIRRNGYGHQAQTVLFLDGLHQTVRPAILCGMDANRNPITGRECVCPPALASQPVDAPHLQRPLHAVAVCGRRLHTDVNVRISEGELSYGPFYSDDRIHIHSGIAVMARNGHSRQANRRKISRICLTAALLWNSVSQS